MMLVGATLQAQANIEDLFYDLTQIGHCDMEEVRRIATELAAGTGTDLGYHSAEGLEERSFNGKFTMPELPEGEVGSYMYGLSIFSDDGCDLSIDGVKVHSHYKRPQGLPRLNESLHEIPILLQPGKEYEFEVNYSNVKFYVKDERPDIDGCTLFLCKVPVTIAVDANRNGYIDQATDLTTANTPYRFWVNNDGDVEEDDELPGAPKAPDFQDDVILTQRDLEDFSRIRLLVGMYHDELKSGAVTATLKFRDGTVEGNPAINLWPQMNPTGSRAYLAYPLIAKHQLTAQMVGTVSKEAGLKLPIGIWDGSIEGFSEASKVNVFRNFLFEGAGEGKGELVLEFTRKGKPMGEAGTCWISLMNVRKMYERAKITPSEVDDYDDPTTFPGEKGNPSILPPDTKMRWVWDPKEEHFVEDPNEDKHYIVFTHGWRMTYERSQKYGETTFKRLWQAGFKGRYVFVRWPTYSQATNKITKAFFTYNKSDYLAWKSGVPMADFINSLPSNYKKSLTAHSMGNVVMSSALMEGAKVQHYALLNAAIPAMCFDDNKELYVNEYESPDGDDDPITKALGYENKIREVNDAELTNFYLRDDGALKMWERNNRYFATNAFIKSAVEYQYRRERDPGERLRAVFVFRPNRNLRSFHEAAAFATLSRTKSVGAEMATMGSIGTSIDMDVKYGFGENHSCQWALRIQKTRRFYEDLLGVLSKD